MSKGFKPGDLALIIRGAYTGKPVELVEYVAPGDKIQFGDVWFRATGEPCWLVTGDGVFPCGNQIDTRKHGLPFALKALTALMPLRDDDLPAETLDTAAPRELVSA